MLSKFAPAVVAVGEARALAVNKQVSVVGVGPSTLPAPPSGEAPNSNNIARGNLLMH